MGIHQNLAACFPCWNLCLLQQLPHPVYGFKGFKHHRLEGKRANFFETYVTAWVIYSLSGTSS
jgi:hypothetical protein